MKTDWKTATLLAAIALAACSDAEQDETIVASEEQQAEMVEDAVRQNYANNGAEVVEIDMARSADGSRFAGYATIRDPATGNDMPVYCTYSQGPGGAPQLTCNRTREGEEATPVVPPRD